MYDIEYNGVSGRVLGIAVTERPNIPAPQPRGTFIDIAGRDGSLLVSDGTYDNIEIVISMNLVRASQWLGDAYRKAKNWISGSGILRMGDDTGWHYRVKKAVISSFERVAKDGGTFEATFICDPFTYKDVAKLSIEDALLNPYYQCKPIYEITGSGDFTLTVNGNSMEGTIPGGLIIDTERMLAYTESGELQNAAVAGNFEGLYLQNGVNTITIDNGEVQITPNWRSL